MILLELLYTRMKSGPVCPSLCMCNSAASGSHILQEHMHKTLRSNFDTIVLQTVPHVCGCALWRRDCHPVIMSHDSILVCCLDNKLWYLYASTLQSSDSVYTLYWWVCQMFYHKACSHEHWDTVTTPLRKKNEQKITVLGEVLCCLLCDEGKGRGGAVQRYCYTH